LHNTLQAQVQPLGVRIYTVRLLCRPEPTMLEAQLAAQARAQELAALAAALGPGYNMAQILPLELLDRLRRGDSRLLTALNLSLPVAPGDANGYTSPAMYWVLGSR
jgi:hypothetical protein